MTTAFMQKVDGCITAARASGDLLPIQTEQTETVDQNLRFIIRWVSSLSAKDAVKVTMPGGPRDPDFNPFLKPDPMLLVGPVGDQHVAILNKFPVSDRHLVLARKEFAEQLSPMDLSDFLALATIMSDCGGVGFYNGGTAAGATQRHKHVQWMPATSGNASLSYLAADLPQHAVEHDLFHHPALAFKHVFVKVSTGQGTDAAQSAHSMLVGFQLACQNLGFEVDDAGLLPAFSMLADNGWLMLVARRCELVGDVPVNALCYGGTLYVRSPEQVPAVHKFGPLALLKQAAVL